jgi:hypothetical protein
MNKFVNMSNVLSLLFRLIHIYSNIFEPNKSQDFNLLVGYGKIGSSWSLKNPLCNIPFDENSFPVG